MNERQAWALMASDSEHISNSFRLTVVNLKSTEQKKTSANIAFIKHNTIIVAKTFYFNALQLIES